MPVHLSVKSVPDAWVDRLKERAAKNHRSLQGELMSILEEVLEGRRFLTHDEALARARNLDLQTDSEARQWVRTDRDKR